MILQWIAAIITSGEILYLGYLYQNSDGSVSCNGHGCSGSW